MILNSRTQWKMFADMIRTERRQVNGSLLKWLQISSWGFISEKWLSKGDIRWDSTWEARRDSWIATSSSGHWRRPSGTSDMSKNKQKSINSLVRSTKTRTVGSATNSTSTVSEYTSVVTSNVESDWFPQRFLTPLRNPLTALIQISWTRVEDLIWS